MEGWNRDDYETSNGTGNETGSDIADQGSGPKYEAANYGYHGDSSQRPVPSGQNSQPADTTYRHSYTNGGGYSYNNDVSNGQNVSNNNNQYYNNYNNNDGSSYAEGSGDDMYNQYNSYNANNTNNTNPYGANASGTGANGGVNQPPKKNSFVKKASILVASAAVFGLVAGGVFQGVNMAADYLGGSGKVSLESTANTTSGSKIPTTTTSSKTELTSDLTELVENTMPSIVSITSTLTEDFSYFGKNYKQDYDASGSGIIIGKDDDYLYIGTNNHMVDGATAIAVTFIDDSVLEATVKGTDTTSDLAVVTIPLKNISGETLSKIKVATLGDSESVKVGQLAVAIGNSCGVGQSVTVGYISAKGRTINTSNDSLASQLELLQTDAAINPGNSGGALLNSAGEVIGINDAKYVDSEIEGMGYAIPITDAIPILEELMNREELKDEEKGYLGITGMNIKEENNYYNMPTGAYIYEVADGGAADKAGIKAGDIIIKINGAAATSIEAVTEKVNNIKAGSEITVTVLRSTDGEYQEKEFTVTLQDKSSLEQLQKSGNTKNSTGGFGYSNGDEKQQDGQSGALPSPEDGTQDQEGNSDEEGNLLDEFFRQFQEGR